MSETDEEVIVANAVLGGHENYEEFDQQIDADKLGEKLVQTNRQKGSLRELQLYDHRYLLISDGDIDGANTRKYRVNLSWVSAEPTHERFIDWKWLYLSIAMGSITSVFVILAVLGELTMDYAMIGGTISLTLTALTTLIFLYRRRDEFTFRGYYGGAGLFLMENRRPTQRIFDAFFVGLQQAIDHSKQNMGTAERLVGELKMVRRLRDEGVIDNREYESTRALIFKHESYSA